MDEHTVVMTRVSEGSGEAQGWYTFNYTDEGGYIRRSVMLHKDHWESIGSPDQLTVTIMPGDNGA